MGFFTLTDAQRAKEFLEHRRIKASVIRMPSDPGVGCAFGLRLRAGDSESARRILEANRIHMGKPVYRPEDEEPAYDLLGQCVYDSAEAAERCESEVLSCK